jgi:UDP-N-acetylglucosamine/UDP-N-acetylgalactosamine 4-epimerase
MRLTDRNAPLPESDQPMLVYNVAVGERTTLNDLCNQIHRLLQPRYPQLQDAQPGYRDFRPGDVRHSLADITKAHTRLGYAPTHRVAEGLDLAIPWYTR